MNLSSNIEINKQLVRNFAEDVFNRHDLAAVDKYMAAGVGFKKYLGEYFLGHPDSRTTIDHIVAEGDKVFVMFTTTATNKQSGKRVTIKSADVYRIENELLAEHWDVVEATVFLIEKSLNYNI